MASAIDINHDAVRIINRIHQLFAARAKVVAAMSFLAIPSDYSPPSEVPWNPVEIARAYKFLELDVVAIDKKIRFEYGRYVAKREQVPDDAISPVSDAPS